MKLFNPFPPMGGFIFVRETLPYASKGHRAHGFAHLDGDCHALGWREPHNRCGLRGCSDIGCVVRQHDETVSPKRAAQRGEAWHVAAASER